MRKTLEAQGDPLKDGLNAAKPLLTRFCVAKSVTYPPNLPDPPRTSLHGNRRVGVYRFPTFLGRRLPHREVFGGLGGARR